MLDLELLKTLVCVVEEGSFTRGAERVHRTQSTVSQQILKLEERVGHPLLQRDRSGKQALPTEQGELLVHYARRLLAMAQEAEDALAATPGQVALRLGVPEDFDARPMSGMLAGFSAAHPALRLETVSGMSSDLQRRLVHGEIDLALMKREPGSGECIAAWPERLVWAVGQGFAPDADGAVPLVLFPAGCIYRLRAVRLLEKAGRPWRQAFGSQSLTSVQAAVAAGLGVSVLPRSALLAEHRTLGRAAGFEPPPPTELALVGAGPRGMPLGRGLKQLADYLVGQLGTRR
ncbi:LysR substrate-binding domain-containing protein [Acidovorax sp. Root217]|uniref:LysR substrate-binding domain-containing protein n=1 Tax=Acidovorax sp. Root217 TaxID=1736492 RepID=UPI0007106440|nr:LysR substrate-binding domain-containing protein [Acidovorax sp. Root217]KRC29552.1 LysR family transcriptional regulator [Acidovorax sp. Root217]